MFGLGGKIAFVGLLLLPFDWKKNPGYLVRELPLALAALGGCLGIDRLVESYVWKPNEALVKRVTGFNGEMFVNPDSLNNMKEMYKIRKAKQEDLTIETDSLINED